MRAYTIKFEKSAEAKEMQVQIRENATEQLS